MKLTEVIRRAKELYPHHYTDEEVLSWCWELTGEIYDKYKKLLDEWLPYEQKVQLLKEEASPFRQGADAEKSALLDFHCEMLDRDAQEYFYDLMDK